MGTGWKGRAPWLATGVVAGLAGLATSYLVAEAMSLRLSPIPAVAELIIRITPGKLIETGIQSAGTNDKPILVWGIFVFLLLASALIGLLARRWWLAPTVGFALLAAVGAVAYLTSPGAQVTDLSPVVVGFVTWLVGISLIIERLNRSVLIDEAGGSEVAASSRRTFLAVGGGVLGVAAVAGGLGRFTGRSQRRVEQARAVLRLPVSQPSVPGDVTVDLEGMQPWMTPSKQFYKVGTAITLPAIEPKDWSLRIHGMVENEITLTYMDLVNRPITEEWLTLNCVSNPVGGDLIGNAWWSGVRLDTILAMAGPLPGADAVLQTSDDGWTCGTPLSAMTDGRDAMLAVAMNGAPLTVEHGFPVRTIVPGLYGYVSATKWVVDMEVTRFDTFSAFWTQRGWSERGPVKMASRIEVPGSGATVPAGQVTFGGTAWEQQTGIRAVDIAVDGGAWIPATLAGSPNDDCWVQWRASADVGPGEHTVRVRATAKDGQVQTAVRQGVLPDGATGLHTIQFTASA